MMSDQDSAGAAGDVPNRDDKPDAPQPDAPPEPELQPTIRDHAERLKLAAWQVRALVARLHGELDEEGNRRLETGADLNTRMSAADFDAALERALHGR